MNDDKEFDKYLKKSIIFFRKLNNMNQTEAAQKAGTTAAHICEWERSRIITFKAIQKLSYAYNVSCSAIIKFAEKLRDGIDIEKYLNKEIIECVKDKLR